ncbi:hypothetical protein Ahy_B02g059134 [Arachis hypogaea]|uniref:DUF223 domain-containing protein n=1 Tax=Arachis hypogaea TaxID=3818 RepID=A0A445AG69_ARAHY|nr:hypothetical protein Ahy_B02g059134 [Arachis hypogaea]
MAGIHKIAEINHTIDNLCVRIRVIRLWTLSNYENSSLPYSIEMVWLDEDEEISYQIRYFGVGLNEGNFKTTHHEYVVNLNQRTDVLKLPESFNTLNALEYDYTYLVNVVGYLAGIGRERTFEKDDKSTKKIMECALFGNYAHELSVFLGSDNKYGVVVVLQFVRNSMYGTKMFFNLEEANVIQFKNSFVKFEELRDNIDAIPNEAAYLKIY